MTGRTLTADPSKPAVPLAQVGRGRRALVVGCLLCGDDCRLLTAMGLGDQCVLRVCRAGEPCIVEVQETRLALCRRIAGKILVLPDHESNGSGDAS